MITKDSLFSKRESSSNFTLSKIFPFFSNKKMANNKTTNNMNISDTNIKRYLKDTYWGRHCRFMQNMYNISYEDIKRQRNFQINRTLSEWGV